MYKIKSNLFFIQVYQTILKYMIEGVAPYASIIYIIGNLSIANMKSFLPLSKHVFSYLVSILPVTKTDNMRKVYATSMLFFFCTFLIRIKFF